MSTTNALQVGLECLRSRDVDGAIRHLEQATNDAPDDYRGYNLLGAAYAQKNLHDRAVSALLTAVYLKPDVASSHFNLGLAYQADGVHEKAIEELERALQLDPNYTKASDALTRIRSSNQEAEDLSLQSCGRHVDEPAVALCSFCRLPICEGCKTLVHNAVYCPNCARQVSAEP